MVITPKLLPQLLTYEDETAKSILRNLKKVEIRNEYRLSNVGVKEYVSIPKLDQKAFRYIEKNGKLYLRESVYSVGGLVQDTVLINLGDFTLGDDETGAGLEYLARVKDAKAKQRVRQLQECERIAQTTLRQIQKQVKNMELIQKWQNELKEDKLFVRLGKEDYYQSQVAIIAKFAPEDETLAKIIVDYDAKINDKSQKWLNPIKLPKAKATDSARIGTQMHEGVGEIAPERRAEFKQYYDARSPQMTAYLDAENEVSMDLPVAPAVTYSKEPTVKTKPADKTVAATKKLQRTQITSTHVQKLRHAFAPNQAAVITQPQTAEQTAQPTMNLDEKTL